MAAHPNAALGRFELFHADGTPMRPDELPGRRALAGEASEPTLVRFRSGTDGRDRYSQVSAIPIRDAQGDVLYVITYFREVTSEHMLARRRDLAAELGPRLGSTLEYETTLREIAAAAVPRVADWCLVELLAEDGSLTRVASEHRDAETLEVLAEISRRWPARPGDPGAARVVLTGEAELVRVIDDELLRAFAKDDEHLRVLCELDLTSYMCVPIRVAGDVIAAATFV